MFPNLYLYIIITFNVLLTYPRREIDTPNPTFCLFTSFSKLFLKVLPKKVPKKAKRRPPFCGGGAKRRLLYFLTFLGSTFKNSFKNDVKRQKVGFGVSISLLGYVKSTLNVR